MTGNWSEFIEIQPNDFEAFKAKAGLLTGKVAVALHGPGGALIAALQIGEYVRLKGWGTFVLDECYSACASIWLAGSPRLMTPQAKIGFHAASLGGLEKGRGNALDDRFHESCHNVGIPLAFPDSYIGRV